MLLFIDIGLGHPGRVHSKFEFPYPSAQQCKEYYLKVFAPFAKESLAKVHVENRKKNPTILPASATKIDNANESENGPSRQKLVEAAETWMNVFRVGKHSFAEVRHIHAYMN